MSTRAVVLSYSGCSTCRRALAWLKAHHIEHEVRPIVEQPPTVAELKTWVKASGKPLAKWLNTSGLSYRALGKAKVQAASEAELMAMLAADGKLVKRPVLVKADTVLVGFDEQEWQQCF